MEKRIIKASFSITLIGVIVKLIGFIKQIVIANFYGATYQTDDFFLVSGFVGNVAYLICTTLSITFLSMYVESKHDETALERNKFVSSVIVIFEGLALIAGGILYVFAPQISRILAVGYDQASLAPVIEYMHLFSFVIIIQVMITILGTVLNAEKKFLPYQTIGAIQSVVIIVSVICLSNQMGIYALVISFIAAYFFQFLYLLVFARKYIKFVLVRPFKDNRVKKLFRLIAPLLVSYGITEINQVVDKMVSTYLGEGVVSALSYSQVISSSINQLFVVSVGTVIFSYFTDYAAKGEESKIKESLGQMLIIVSMILLPISIMLTVDAQEIVKVLYERGNFDAAAVGNTALAQIGYAAGLWFLGIRELLVRTHYAYQDTKRPTINSVISVLFNIVLSIVLSRTLGILGITLASSISMVISVVLLSATLREHISGLKEMFAMRKSGFLKILAASIVLILYSLVLKKLSLNLYMELVLLAAGGGIIYLLVLYLLKLEEMKAVMNAITVKLNNGKSK